jgi:hypothetical protein
MIVGGPKQSIEIIYHSQFGFVGTNPFRPRVLAAGAWFLFFTGIPASVAVGFRKEPWLFFAKNAYALWIAFLLLSVPFGNLLFDFSPIDTPVAHTKWGWIFPIMLLILVVGAVITIDFLTLNKKSSRWQWVAAVLSVVVTLYFASAPTKRLFTDHHFDLSSIALWFFATMLIVRLELRVRLNRNLAEYGEWAKPSKFLPSLVGPPLASEGSVRPARTAM